VRIAILRIISSTALFFVAWAALLIVPRPFFAASVRANNLVLTSDRPFSETAGKHVLELAERKLQRSPLFSTRRDYNVYICNSGWRQKLFFNKDYNDGVGGVAQYPITPNVFLRSARVEDNRLIAHRGNPVPGDRTLDYYVAHEIAHQLTGEAIGPLAFYRLPQWVREGYADYVGKGDAFDYREARRAFLAHEPAMDFRKSGLYSRFHLLVAHVLDRQHWTVIQLLKNPPGQQSVEADIGRQ